MSNKVVNEDTTNVTDSSTPLTEKFGGILNTLSSFRQQITMLQGQVRSLDKCVKKQMKTMAKEVKKNKNKGNRKPSGFAVPTNITEDLCKFMDKPVGTQLARTEVTQYIINYIKSKDLQYSKNRKIIKPDNKLKKLLGVKDDEEVTYFNLQKYMNKHFVKKNNFLEKVESKM